MRGVTSRMGNVGNEEGELTKQELKNNNRESRRLKRTKSTHTARIWMLTFLSHWSIKSPATTGSVSSMENQETQVKDVLSTIAQVVHFRRARGLIHRQSKSFLGELGPECRAVPYHRGEMVQLTSWAVSGSSSCSFRGCYHGQTRCLWESQMLPRNYSHILCFQIIKEQISTPEMKVWTSKGTDWTSV